MDSWEGVMNEKCDELNLTPALEDYLETIWTILQRQKVARVKEIAEAHDVRMASVTPALKRLSKLGLVEYSPRGLVDLTPDGERFARRIKARHDLLQRFFTDVLGVSEESAQADAHAIEHVITDESLDHMVRWFEYLERCPTEHKRVMRQFLHCNLVHPEQPKTSCRCATQVQRRQTIQQQTRYVSTMEPGESAQIAQIVSDPTTRRNLIDRGFFPAETITFVRIDLDGEPLWVRLGNEELKLSMLEAESIVVVPEQDLPVLPDKAAQTD